MGHRSKKNIQGDPVPGPNSPFDINNIGRLLNNVDINSMSNTLHNMDLNQVLSVLSKAFTPQSGTPPGSPSPNAGNSASNASTADIKGNNTYMASASEYFNPFKDFNIPDSSQINATSKTPLSHILPPNDPTVMILNSLKPLIPSDKSIIIDNMIQIYGIKMVIDKIFPPSVQTNNLYQRNNSNIDSPEEQTTDKAETSEEIN